VIKIALFLKTKWKNKENPDKFFQQTFIYFFLITVILAVYWQVTSFEFINLDDPLYVIGNQSIRHGINPESIKWAFSSVEYASNWHPITWISHALDIQFFGMNPGMHHLTNVIFHIVNTILLFIVLEKMTGALWRSAVVAALFALHPLHVESVAWISERKDVLSTFFWLLTMLGYIWYIQQRTVLRYLVVILSYILGLLSKPMLVTLPFILLLLDYWPLNRLETIQKVDIRSSHGNDIVGSGGWWSRLSTLILEKIPLILCALISCGVTFYAQLSSGAVNSLEKIKLIIRIANAIISYVVYLEKMVWPIKLAVFYPYPEIINPFEALLCTLFLLIITTLILIAARNLPYLAVGWVWYLVTLIPVIGIVQVGAQQLADRYTYISLVGIFIIVVWGFTDILTRWRYGKVVLGVLSAFVFTLLMITTWEQLGTWKDSETLFRHALAVTKNNYLAHNNLGVAISTRGDIEGAIWHYRQAIKIKPNYIRACDNIGFKLFDEKKYNEALNQFQECLKIDPENSITHIGLGDTLMATSSFTGAIRSYTEALRINPNHTEVYSKLGLAYLKKGNFQDSIKYCQKALMIEPDDGIAIKVLEVANIAQLRIEGSILELVKSLQTQPENPEIHYKLGDIYQQQGKYDEAIFQLQKAISINPTYSQAMYKLVVVYSDLQDYTNALSMLQKMRLLQPANPEIYYNIACIYAKQNKVSDSISWLKQAIEKGFHNWELIKSDSDLANIRNTAFVHELIKNH
jgi:protein O-mannosyl-transferase